MTQNKQEVQVAKEYPKSVDRDGYLAKESREHRFEYKKHHLTDNQGLVLGVLTTKASTNEITNLEEALWMTGLYLGDVVSDYLGFMLDEKVWIR